MIINKSNVLDYLTQRDEGTLAEPVPVLPEILRADQVLACAACGADLTRPITIYEVSLGMDGQVYRNDSHSSEDENSGHSGEGDNDDHSRGDVLDDYSVDEGSAYMQGWPYSRIPKGDDEDPLACGK